MVGASTERDADIVKATGGLYDRLGVKRVYFSAYQRGLGDPTLPGEQSGVAPADLLTREHRLYQTDWLIRQYGFAADEIPFEPDGNLSLLADPKQVWAERHPEFFPLDVNRADRYELLRVPGFGPVTVRRILALRKHGGKVRTLAQLGKLTRRLLKAEAYVTCG